MRVSPLIPSRPALRYYGGGWLRAEWTIGHFPVHNAYCEPCFGAGSILAKKPIAPFEVVNDLDGRVINFFRVLREQPDQLLEQINLTPWAENELASCHPVSPLPLEDARRFFAICWMSIQGGPNPSKSSFRWTINRFTAPPSDAIGRDDLLVMARRLKNVQILNRQAHEVVRPFLGNPDSLIYFDPPYLAIARATSRGYNHEPSPAWHRYMAILLRQSAGAVVVAGYASRLYQRIYEVYGWRRVEREFSANSGSSGMECLWLNPRCQDLLAAEMAPAVASNLSLF